MRMNNKKLIALIGVLAVLITSAAVYANPGNSQDENGIEVNFDKEKYSPSDLVEFTVKNLDNESVEFKNGAPWTVKMKVDGDWKKVEDHMATMQVWELEPDDSSTWTWDPENSLEWYTDLDDKSGTYAVFIKDRKFEFTVEE